MLPKLHPLQKTYIDIKRSKERVELFRRDRNSEQLAEISGKLAELLVLLDNYKEV
jgi:hypothetical protein